MKTEKAWKVTVNATQGGTWKGRFLFKPTRNTLVIAIDGDIEDGQRWLERCDHAEAIEGLCDQERLRNLQEVALHVKSDYAENQVRKRVLVAGTLVGTVQVTTEKVYTP